MAGQSVPWPATILRHRRSPSSSTPPPRTSPCSPSPPTPANAKPTVREVERFGASLPEGSYGRRNRQAIAARETRVAIRLRAIEHAYRTAADPDAIFRPIHPARPPLPQHTADREIELE